MATANSLKRQNSTIAKNLQEDEKIIDCSFAYAFQEHNIILQNAEHSMIKAIIDILSTSSHDIKECQTKWKKFFKDNGKNLSNYESIWHVFDAAVSSVDLLTQDIDEKILNLRLIQNLISDQKDQESFKDQIEQARSTVDQLSQELDHLKKKETKLRRQIYQFSNGSWTYKLRNKVFRTRQQNPTDKLKMVTKSIKKNKRLLRTETATFNENAVNIISRNKKSELGRTQSMKQHLTGFVQTFGKVPQRFNNALAKCDPEEDINRWEQTILRQNSEQSVEDSDEDVDIKKTSCQQTTENGNRDKKTNPRLNSVKYPSVENNTKELTRQSSVRPASVVDEKRANKTNKNRESIDTTAAEVEEVNKTD